VYQDPLPPSPAGSSVHRGAIQWDRRRPPAGGSKLCVYTETAWSREGKKKQGKEEKKIGGLLRFAPGRLGARKARAPLCCGIHPDLASRLPCADLGSELRPKALQNARASLAVCAGMATGSAMARDALAVAG
jgi:hypothetical protein